MFGSLSTVAVMLLGMTGVARSTGLIDPLTRYANMTLELPEQTFPILHTDFEYPPDCGETTYRGSGRLAGLKALVTGGDSGIGRAIVIAYLREGASIAINYLPSEEDDAQALSDFVAGEGLSFTRIPGDLTNETFCTELVRKTNESLGGLDILINHAGYAGNIQGPHWLPMHEIDTEEIEHVYKVNVFAPLWLTRAAIPYLRPGASIVTTSSGLIGHPVATSVIYGSSKAAITHTIRSIAQQLRPRGIRVNGVAPPLTYTPFLATGGFDTEMIANATRLLGMGRLAQPAEVAPHYVDVVDPSRTYMSGEVVTVLGGDAGF